MGGVTVPLLWILASCAVTSVSEIAPPTDPCVAADDALAAYDAEGARQQFAVCTVERPDDPVAWFGLGFTTLLALGDSAPAQTVAGWCGEPTPGSAFLGRGGYLADLEAVYGGESTLGVAFEDRAGEVALDLWPAPKVETSWDADDREVVVVVQTGSGGGNTLRITVPSSFRQEDGLEIDVASLGGAWSAVIDFWPSCSWPGACGRSDNEQPARGTLRFERLGTTEGSPVELEVDLDIPASCDESDCSDSWYHVEGRVSDEVTTFPSQETLPLGDWSGDCAHDYCESETEFFALLAEHCDVPSHGAVAEQVVAVADLLDGAAAMLERSAVTSLRAEMDQVANPLVSRTIVWNQVDALVLAGAARLTAGSLRLAFTREVFDPELGPDDLTDFYEALPCTYPEDGANCIEEGTSECDPVTAWGLSIEQAHEQLSIWALDPSSNSEERAELARVSLLRGISDLIAALEASPEVDAHLAFHADPEWRDTMLLDLGALAESLDGSDGPLPSSPSWTVTLGAFFAAMPDRNGLLGAFGLESLLTLEREGYGCAERIELDPKVVSWLEHGFDAFVVPEAYVRDRRDPPLLLDERVYDDWDPYPPFFAEELVYQVEVWGG